MDADCFKKLRKQKKLPSIEDVGQLDLIATPPTRAGLRRCRAKPHASPR